MAQWLYDILFPLVRWVHIVSMTLIVGGTLFFELVLPVAIEDLKREQQLYVFARARLVWRWVVWISAIGLIVSGSLSLYPMWGAQGYTSYVVRWAIAHIAIGLITILIAMLLTSGRQPPENPVMWMRLNLAILLVVIFLGNAARHFQVAPLNTAPREGKTPAEGALVDVPKTQPSTPPTQ